MHPVKVAKFWVIFDSPDRPMKVFPQKSFAALLTLAGITTD